MSSLSNADFANMIRSGENLGGGDDGGKTRFDLRQVRQWDEQNKQTFVKKSHRVDGGGGGGREREKKEKKPTGDKLKKSALEAAGYRDRALERRKEEALEVQQLQQQQGEQGHTQDEDMSRAAFTLVTGLRGGEQDEQALIARLDSEQTKYLGGDLAHTHLVKGLDYALLAKVRAQVARAQEGEKKESAARGGGSRGVARKKDLNIFDEDEEELEHDEERDRERDADEDQDQSEDEEREPRVVKPVTSLGLSLQRLLFDDESQRFTQRNFSIDLDRDEIRRETEREIHALRDRSDRERERERERETEKRRQVQQSYGQREDVSLSSQAGLDAKERLSRSHVSRAGDVLKRTSYLFHLRVEDETDVPLTVLRSKAAIDVREDYVHYALPDSLSTRLRELCADAGHFVAAKARSKTIAPPTAPARPTAAPAPAPAPLSLANKTQSIYDDEDDLEAPAAAAAPPVVETTPLRTARERNSIVCFSDEEEEERESGAALRGLFRNLKPTAPLLAAQRETVAKDVLQPVREMLIAQGKREGLAKQQREREREREREQQSRQRAQREGEGEDYADESGAAMMINRDVFATTKDKVVLAKDANGPQGDVFGLQGDYDLYPETGEYDILSDEEGDDKMQALSRKRARLENDEGETAPPRSYGGKGGKTPGRGLKK